MVMIMVTVVCARDGKPEKGSTYLSRVETATDGTGRHEKRRDDTRNARQKIEQTAFDLCFVQLDADPVFELYDRLV